MINTKSDSWSDIPLESKREMWRLYHVGVVYYDIFFGDSYTSQDSCEEVEVEGGFQWVYKWNDPSDAPKEAVNGVFKLPIFTKEVAKENYYEEDLSFYHSADDEPLGYKIIKGEVVYDDDYDNC